MKRFIALALTALALVVISAPTLAAIVGTATGTVHMVTEPLKIRTHKAAIVGNEGADYGVDVLGGFVDSVYAQAVGVQSFVADTTAPIDTRGWPLIHNQALSDTSGFFCQFIVADATGSGCESGADSLYLGVQVSADGINWAHPKTFVGGTAPTPGNKLPQTNVAGGFYGALSLNGAALANGAPVWKLPLKVRAANVWDELSYANLQGWPFMRLIIGYPDAKGYKVKAFVSHLSTNEAGEK